MPPTIVNIPISNQHLVRNNQDNDFNNYKLSNILSVSVNNQPIEDNDLLTKFYADSLDYMKITKEHRRDLGLEFL